MKTIVSIPLVVMAISGGTLLFFQADQPGQVEFPLAQRGGMEGEVMSEEANLVVPERINFVSEERKVIVPVDTIAITGYAYDPPILRVKKGTTVTWINHDGAKHTITSDFGPESQLLALGEEYQHTFETVGTATYSCEPHPYMKGIVEVTE